MASVIAAGTTSGTALNLSGDTSGVLQLQTNGTTAALTIDTSQNVLVGATAQLNSEKQYIYQSANGMGLQINCVNASQTDYAFRIRAARNTSNGTFNALGYYNDGAGAYRFILTDGGNISTFGGQITFPATQSASSDANTLDDYEEGTFTPTDVSGANLTFAAASGWYTKIGRQVFLAIRVIYPSNANGSAAKIGNFPFANSGANTGGFLVGSDSGLNLNFRIETTTSTHITSGGTFTAVTNSQLSAKEVQLTYVYFT